MTQWCVEEAAAAAFERLQDEAPAAGVSETKSAHERIVAAANEGRLVS